jgi:hypothetical protein
MSQPEDERSTIIEVETERVEGVIDLVEIVRPIQENTASRAQEARTVQAAEPGIEQRLSHISDLAGQLAQALSALPETR